MNTATIIGIISIAIGAVCVASAFAACMDKKPTYVPVALGIVAFVTLTLIPVFLAVFYATSPG